MSIKLFTLTSIALTSLVLPAFAQAGSPVMVRAFKDWGVYSYKDDGSTTCYVLTTPRKALPSSVNHGDNYFLVAPDPSGPGYYPQAVMGYDLKGGTKMKVIIDGKQFVMTPKGNSGWTSKASADAALVEAMKAGHKMTLQATSRRGTSTSYTFSLSGVTAALNQAGRCN